MNFNLYIEQIENFFIATGKDGATDKVKVAVLQAVGGPEMVALVKHVGKVKLVETPAVRAVIAAQGVAAVDRVEAVPADTFETVVEKIRQGIRGQTNQAMAKFKLFKEMQQDSKAFAEWWPDVLEQAERCDWSNYSSEMAARDAILYQTSNKRLKKKILAADLAFHEACKFGVASEQLEKDVGRTEDGQQQTQVRRLEEQRARSQLRRREEQLARIHGAGEGEEKCATCSRRGGHTAGYTCPGLKVECFDCHKMGHYRKAPICAGSENFKREQKNKKKGAGSTPRAKATRRTASEEESTDTSSDSLGRIGEEVVVRRAKTGGTEEEVLVSIRPGEGGNKAGLRWIADSGVNRSLVSEEHWNKLKDRNPSLKLRKTKINFRPYGTTYRLPVLGKAKVVLKCREGAKVNTTVYVIRGYSESLLGKRDGQKLGIIAIKPEGVAEEVRKIMPVVKQEVRKEGIVSGGQTQQETNEVMEQIKKKFTNLFREGIGEAKVEPIHIYVKPGVKPVVQRQRPVPLHYMKPLKEHIELLLKEGVIEGPLGSQEATEGWIHNVVITAKGWDSNKNKNESRHEANGGSS